MIYYDETTGKRIVTGTGNRVARVDGAVPTTWPTRVAFGNHVLQVSQDGTLRLEHGGSLSENPAVGAQANLGSFTYTLTDGVTETAAFTATLTLNGVAISPRSVGWQPQTVRANSPAGTIAGRLSAIGTAPCTFSLVSSSAPLEVMGNEIRTKGVLAVGDHSFTIRADNAQGGMQSNLVLTVTQAATGGLLRGQSDPATAPGPRGGEATFLSARGTVLHPTGSGVYRYVNGATGSDSNNGLTAATPYKTIQKAINAHQAGDSILVEPGIYPEALVVATNGQNRATATNRVKLSRRGNGKVDITATNTVTGWTKCLNGDANGNPNWSNIWKATIQTAHPVPLNACVLLQDSKMAFLRISGAGYTATDQMFSQNDYTKFWTSTNAGLSGSVSGGIITLTSASVLGTYPAGSLDDAVAVIHFSGGNNTAQGAVTSHSPSSGTITAPFGSTYGNGLLLMNVARDINSAGQWAYKDNGNGTTTLYFWPYDPSKMSLVRLTAREYVMNTAAASYWTFYGIDGTGAGGVTQRQGTIFWSNENLYFDKPGLIFEECRAANYCNSGNVGQGIELQKCPGIKLFNSTFELGQNAKGISIIQSPGGWTDRCLVDSMANTAVNLSTAFEQVFSYSEIRNIRSTHGNGMSLYQGTRRVVVWGNKFDTDLAIGMTNQSSADLWIGMNLMVAPQGEPYGHRGIENNSTYPPQAYQGAIFSGSLIYLNNSVVPWSSATGTENVNAMITGKTTNATHHACNNVSFGGIDPTDNGARKQPTTVTVSGTTYATTIGRYRDNVVISNYNSAIGSNPFYTSGANVHHPRPADVFQNYTSGDYRPKPGGPLDGVGGDHSDLLPKGAWIDWFDFARDVEGRSFVWTTGAPKGALLP